MEWEWLVMEGRRRGCREGEALICALAWRLASAWLKLGIWLSVQRCGSCTGMSEASALTRRPSLAAMVDDQSDTNHPADRHAQRLGPLTSSAGTSIATVL